jgi:hypothetical protein
VKKRFRQRLRNSSRRDKDYHRQRNNTGRSNAHYEISSGIAQQAAVGVTVVMDEDVQE